MRAARLDSFSARLHAIHRKNAKEARPEPAGLSKLTLEPSAPETATRMPADEDGALRLLGIDYDDADDDEPPGAGHFATTMPRDEPWPPAPSLDRERSRDPPAPLLERTHEYAEAYAEQRAYEERRRTSARDDDAREDIRLVRRRLGALESEVKSLKEQLDKLTAHAHQPVQEADDPAEPDQRAVSMQATDAGGQAW